MRTSICFVVLAMAAALLTGCPDDKKDANAPATSSTTAATAPASASATPKAAGTGDNKGSGW